MTASVEIPGFTHQTQMVGDLRLHYVIGGQGAPLVLLHGWPETWFMWRKIMPALAAHYTVLAPDLRGFGDSGKPTAGYDTRTLAADVHGLVALLVEQGALSSNQVYLAGHDMGAVHAYTYAAEHRDEVLALVYLDEPLPSQGYEQFANLAEFHQDGGFWFASFNMVPDLPEALTAGRERLLLSFIYNSLALNPAALYDALDEYVRCFELPGAARASRGVYREIFTSSAQIKELSQHKLTIPVLALGGIGGMGEVPLQNLRAVAENVQGGVLPNCGHYIAEEQPEELTGRLLAFFAEAGRAA